MDIVSLFNCPRRHRVQSNGMSLLTCHVKKRSPSYSARQRRWWWGDVTLVEITFSTMFIKTMTQPINIVFFLFWIFNQRKRGREIPHCSYITLHHQNVHIGRCYQIENPFLIPCHHSLTLSVLCGLWRISFHIGWGWSAINFPLKNTRRIVVSSLLCETGDDDDWKMRPEQRRKWYPVITFRWMYNKKLAIHQLLLYSTHFSQSGMQIERRETEPQHLLCSFIGTCKGARISSSSL